jgi:hypothetical protein
MSESIIRIQPRSGPIVMDVSLPTAFANFEPLVAEWALANEKARAEKRVSTPIEVLRNFQQIVMPDFERVIQYLNTLPNDPSALSPPDKRLFQLAQMVMEASAPLDLQWSTPDIDDVFPLERIKFLPPSI